MIIKNLTPHGVNFIQDGKTVLTIQPEKESLRLEEKRQPVSLVALKDGVEIPVYEKSFGSASLPEQKKDTIYIVSLPVAQAFPERQDFLVPDILVRDKAGRIVGCNALARLGKGKGGDSE